MAYNFFLYIFDLWMHLPYYTIDGERCQESRMPFGVFVPTDRNMAAQIGKSAESLWARAVSRKLFRRNREKTVYKTGAVVYNDSADLGNRVRQWDVEREESTMRFVINREYPAGGKDTQKRRSAVRSGVSLCNEARVACVIGQI